MAWNNHCFIISHDAVGWLGSAGLFCSTWSQLGLHSPGFQWGSFCPGWLSHMAAARCGLHVARGCVPRRSISGVSTPQNPSWMLQDFPRLSLGSQTALTALVKQVTNYPGSKGTGIPPLSLVEVLSLHFWRKGQLGWVQVPLQWAGIVYIPPT